MEKESVLELLGRKYSVDILLFLLKNSDPVCKSRIQYEMANGKTVLERIKELSDAGLIERTNARNIKYNIHWIRLTEIGADIAKVLDESAERMNTVLERYI